MVGHRWTAQQTQSAAASIGSRPAPRPSAQAASQYLCNQRFGGFVSFSSYLRRTFIPPSPAHAHDRPQHGLQGLDRIYVLSAHRSHHACMASWGREGRVEGGRVTASWSETPTFGSKDSPVSSMLPPPHW